MHDAGWIIEPYSVQHLPTNKLVYCEPCNYDFNAVQRAATAYRNVIVNELHKQKRISYCIEQLPEKASVIIARITTMDIIVPAFVCLEPLQVPVIATHFVLPISATKAMILHFERIQCQVRANTQMLSIQLNDSQLDIMEKCLQTLFLNK